MRNPNVDIAKGILLILVILGHILQGSFTESLPRYLIYGFHMPLFMTISGYLFSAHIDKISTSDWLLKTFKRAVIPWLLAVVVFALYLNYVGYYHLSLQALAVESITFPFYHLWFIPAWISYQCSLRAVEKIKFPPRMMFWISFLISTVFMWLQTSGQPWINLNTIPILKQVLHVFRPQFFFFFILGYIIKNHPSAIPSAIVRTLKNPVHSIAAAAIFTGVFFLRNGFPQQTVLHSTAYAASFLYLNTTLSFWSLSKIASNQWPQVPLLNWIGQQSLLIYLWHPMAIMIAKYTISYRPTPQFYFSSVTTTISILVLIYFYERFRRNA